jgi:hypothetical protein
MRYTTEWSMDESASVTEIFYYVVLPVAVEGTSLV